MFAELYNLFSSFLQAEGTIATDMEQATGLEKKELDAQLAGEEVQSYANFSVTVSCMYILLTS